MKNMKEDLKMIDDMGALLMLGVRVISDLTLYGHDQTCKTEAKRFLKDYDKLMIRMG